MANYTLFADNDKKQVNGSAITAASTVYDGGSAAGLGTVVPTDSVLTGVLVLGGRSEVHGSQVVQGKTVFGAFQGTPVALTSVADDGSGFCDFTLATHGLVVGQVFSVTGSTAGGVDGVHKITSVPDVNSIVTDKAYVASATAGNYALVAGNYAVLTAEQFVLKAYTTSVAGGQYTGVGYGADYAIRRSIHKLEHLWTSRVATAIRAGYWNMFSGSWTTDPTTVDDVTVFTGLVNDHAATPTYAIPGELTYRVSGAPDGTTGVTQDDYEAKTG